jgi:protein-tyrosine phosphatase
VSIANHGLFAGAASGSPSDAKEARIWKNIPGRWIRSPPHCVPHDFKVCQQVAKIVLFICTGNFYRSRFAEAVFNYHASKEDLPWKAISRGLAIHWATGPLSPFTAGALAVRRIPLHHTGPDRMQLTEDDLKSADLRVVMDRREHFAMMMEHFPLWSTQVEYWDVPDVPINQPEEALPAIEGKVLELLERLSK